MVVVADRVVELTSSGTWSGASERIKAEPVANGLLEFHFMTNSEQ